MASPLPALEVFYDGGCPLCRREIALYRALTPPGRVRYTDLTRERERLAAAGVGVGSAMRRIHAVAADGRLHIGVPAFLEMWRRLPGGRWLAPLLEPLAHSMVAARAYERFAHRRFLARCADGAC